MKINTRESIRISKVILSSLHFNLTVWVFS